MKSKLEGYFPKSQTIPGIPFASLFGVDMLASYQALPVAEQKARRVES